VCPRSTRTHHFSKAVALLVAGRVLVLRQIANALIEHYSDFRSSGRMTAYSEVTSCLTARNWLTPSGEIGTDKSASVQEYLSGFNAGITGPCGVSRYLLDHLM
jgi:hypothetical protein